MTNAWRPSGRLILRDRDRAGRGAERHSLFAIIALGLTFGMWWVYFLVPSWVVTQT